MTALPVNSDFQLSSTAHSGMNRPLPSQALDTRFVDPTCDPEWDDIVASHPNSSFFHSSAWARVLCKTYGHKPVSLQFSRNGDPVSLLPLLEVESPFTGRRAVSLPFTDYCHPLFFGECHSSTMSDKLCKLARERQWKYFELRGGTAPAAPSAVFYGHKLDLRSSTENLFARLNSSARGAIRKAERCGLKVRRSQSREAILEYYRLHVQTRRRHGLPPQPLSFFLNIHDEIIQPGLGFVMTAYSESRAAAGSVFFHIGKKAVYKFSASDESLKQFQANNLVIWKAIEFLAQNGIEELHFGRTPLENEGLRRFKLAWGTVEEEIRYFRFDNSTNHRIMGTGNVPNVLRTVSARLPLCINRLLGAIIYPHLSTIAIALSPSEL
jgi:lipid II:glycine glycyltransferase (peptidoglycan interpeptide bridge formation enzyme)